MLWVIHILSTRAERKIFRMTLVLFLYLLFASTFTLGKAVLYYIPPILFVGVRMVAAGSLLLGYQFIFKRAKFRFEWQDLSSFFYIALFLIFIAFSGEFWALQYVSAAKACLLYNLSPFITALLAYILLSERLTKKQWMGLVIGFAGFLPILMNQSGQELLTRHVWFFSMPELLLLMAVASSCYGWIVMRYLIVNRNYSAVLINGVGMLGGGVMALIASYFVEGTPHMLEQSMPLDERIIHVALYTGLLILIANVICFNLYGMLLRRYSATFLAFAGFMTPIFAAFFDLIFFKEPVPMAFFATIVLVFFGLWIFYQDELRA